MQMKRQLPKYEQKYFFDKKNKYALLIPTLNEGKRIQNELMQIKENGFSEKLDIFILDSQSTDGSLSEECLLKANVRAILNILEGRQGSAFRAGINEVLNQGYEGIITIDGNNKDNVEALEKYIKTLDEGFDFIQGSRFMLGAKHENTPLIRVLAMKLILIPWVNFLSGYKYSEVASAFRGYSSKLLSDETINIFRDCFISYEFLWYLSVQAPKKGYKVKEIPTERCYPKQGKLVTKITTFGCLDIILQLIKLTVGKYNIKDKNKNF